MWDIVSWTIIVILVIVIIVFVVFSSRRSAPDPPGCTDLTQTMRKLWTDHVFWTREVIIADLYDLSNLNTSLTRLLENQQQLGKAFATYYGTAVGDAIANLLTTHINQAVDVVNAAKTSSPDLAKAINDWMKNADDIAQELAKINPQFTLQQLTEMMHAHLNLTIAEVQSLLKKDGSDVAAFEAVLNEILMMSDALSVGIGKQFGMGC